MGDGIHLTLMIGPAVPVPVPKSVLDALVSIQVTTASGSASGFQLNFALSDKSPLHTLFLFASGASLLPILRVVIMVTLGGRPEVLMDGVVTHNEVSSGAGGASTLTVMGQDLCTVMDYLELDGIPYPAMPPEVRVLTMLAKYAMFGVVPLVIPSLFPDLPNPVDRIPSQRKTDLYYIKKLAKEVGYVFYHDPGPLPCQSVAYWGPQIKIGVPQPALNVNMQAHTNVESLNFSYDPEAPVMPIVFIQEQASKVPIPIPIPDIGPLNPPLGVIPPIPKRFKLMSGTSMLSPMQAVMLGMAEAARSADAITGRGELNVLRYGHVLKARKLVGVRGAGQAYDGLYYVNKVTHTIRRGEYRQSFELQRNGLLSTIPRVPV